MTDTQRISAALDHLRAARDLLRAASAGAAEMSVQNAGLEATRALAVREQQSSRSSTED
jgi:hypothetical protein